MRERASGRLASVARWTGACFLSLRMCVSTFLHNHHYHGRDCGHRQRYWFQKKSQLRSQSLELLTSTAKSRAHQRSLSRRPRVKECSPVHRGRSDLQHDGWMEEKSEIAVKTVSLEHSILFTPSPSSPYSPPPCSRINSRILTLFRDAA